MTKLSFLTGSNERAEQRRWWDGWAILQTEMERFGGFFSHEEKKKQMWF